MAVAACKDQEASLKDGAFKARHLNFPPIFYKHGRIDKNYL